MVTLHRAYGYRFVIFTNDHSPPHVHVVGNGGEAKIALDPLELEWVDGIGWGDMRRLMLEAQDRRDFFVAEWERIHG